MKKAVTWILWIVFAAFLIDCSIIGVKLLDRNYEFIKVCEEDCIPSVSKVGYMWLIPKDTEKPADKRIRINKA